MIQRPRVDAANRCFPATVPRGRRIDPPRKEEEWVVLELFGNVYVTAGDYKAIRVRPGMYGDGEWYLYGIESDPGETRPLESEQSERLQNMTATFERYAEEKGLVPLADDWSPWGQL